MARDAGARHRLVVVGRARRHVDVRIEELHDGTSVASVDRGRGRCRPGRCGPAARRSRGVVGGHARELGGRRGRPSPTMRASATPLNIAFRTIWLKLSSGKCARGIRVLAGDRLEDGLHVRAARLDRERHEALRASGGTAARAAPPAARGCRLARNKPRRATAARSGGKTARAAPRKSTRPSLSMPHPSRDHRIPPDARRAVSAGWSSTSALPRCRAADENARRKRSSSRLAPEAPIPLLASSSQPLASARFDELFER